MSFLPAVGTFSYNGFTFNGTTKSAIDAVPVYDQASRTVSYIKYTIKARTIIQNASGTDTEMLDLRNRLMKPGSQFVYTGHGFGAFSINTSEAGAKDVVWGPKPIRCEFEPLGTPNAWAVEWQCEVAIPQCSSAKYKNRVMAYNYEIGYRIDDQGLTTRTYSGYVEIPMTRWVGGSRMTPDSVDLYREQIAPLLVPGFQRIEQDFQVSSDKRTLKFSIIDQQIPGDGLPLYCTEATGRHDVGSMDLYSTYRYQGTISATYRVAYGQPKERAVEAFNMLVSDRLGEANRVKGPAFPGLGPQKPNDEHCFLMGCKTSEGLYKSGREVSFEVSYIFTATIETVLAKSGGWRPIPGTEWSRWAESIYPAQLPRGTAGLFHSPNDDALIDLCIVDEPNPPLPTSVRGLKGKQTQEFSLKVKPGSTWVDYHSSLKTIGEPGTRILKTLPTEHLVTQASTGGPLAPSLKTITKPPAPTGTATQPPKPPPAESGDNDPASAMMDSLTDSEAAPSGYDVMQSVADLMERAKLSYPNAYVGPDTKPPKPPKPKQKIIPLWLYVLNQRWKIQQSTLTQNPDVVQQGTTPAYGVILRGWGIRVGYHVPYPKLYSVGGVAAVPDGEGVFEQAVVANWGGYPVYYARWAIPFRLLQPPKKVVGVPQNPALFVGG